MDADSHHQNQGHMEVGQLVEGTADTPGHVIGKNETCYRAQRGQAPLGYWPRDRCPGMPAAQASHSIPSYPIPPHLTLRMSTVSQCGWQSSRQAGYGGGGSWREMFIGNFLVGIEGLLSHLQRNGSIFRTLEWLGPLVMGPPPLSSGQPDTCNILGESGGWGEPFLEDP